MAEINGGGADAGPKSGPCALVRALELRVEKLEKQLAALRIAKKPPAGAARTYRDSFDALDYPDR